MPQPSHVDTILLLVGRGVGFEHVCLQYCTPRHGHIKTYSGVHDAYTQLVMELWVQLDGRRQRCRKRFISVLYHLTGQIV